MTYDNLESKAAIDPQLPIYKTMEETVEALNRGEKAFYVSGAMVAPLSPEEKATRKKAGWQLIFVTTLVCVGFFGCIVVRVAYPEEYVKEEEFFDTMLEATGTGIFIFLCTIAMLFSPWQSHIKSRLRTYTLLSMDKRRSLYSFSDEISKGPRKEDRLSCYSTKQVQEDMWLIEERKERGKREKRGLFA